MLPDPEVLRYAGGMAKGFAKGTIFNAVMGDASELGSKHAAGKTAAKPVDNKQGSTNTDGHAKIIRGDSTDAEGSLGPYKATAVTAGKSIAELQQGIDYVRSLSGTKQYDENSLLKAENDFLFAIRSHPDASNKLTSTQLEMYVMRSHVLSIQAETANMMYQGIKYGSLATGTVIYNPLSNAETAYAIYSQGGVSAKEVTSLTVDAVYSGISKGAGNHKVINGISIGLSEFVDKLPWKKESE